MHLREKAALVGRPSAGRQLAVAMAATGLVAGLTLTSGVASAAATAANSPGRAVSATSLANLKIVPRISGVQLMNAHSTKCLSSDGRGDADALQFNCNTSSANQYWVLGHYYGGSNFSQWINQGTHQCLGVRAASKANGADVVVWRCLGTGHPDQYWSVGNNGSGPGVDFTDLRSGDCLQIAGDSTASGARANQEPYDEAGSPNQTWFRGEFSPHA
jgi:hypothetical protein